MANFQFRGGVGTFIVFTGGVVGSANPGVPTKFKGTVGKGVGISLTGFSFEVDCPCEVPQPGDTIKVSATTLVIASKVRIEYSLCGGQCTGVITKWQPGLGLGISGQVTFTY